jgi:hypothetical protein
MIDLGQWPMEKYMVNKWKCEQCNKFVNGPIIRDLMPEDFVDGIKDPYWERFCTCP